MSLAAARNSSNRLFLLPLDILCSEDGGINESGRFETMEPGLLLL